MSGPDPRIEAFYAEDRRWQQELLALRGILRACPLTEEWKWRQPCYTHDGGNVATLWGFADTCTLGFFKGVLLKDPAGILEPPGPHSRSSRVVRFRSAAEIAGLADTLKDYILEAVALEKAGATVAFEGGDIDYPEELTQKMDADPDFAAAFEALTPGRQRGYLLHFTGAKQSKTRAARIEKHALRILQGKGMHDR